MTPKFILNGTLTDSLVSQKVKFSKVGDQMGDLSTPTYKNPPFYAIVEWGNT